MLTWCLPAFGIGRSRFPTIGTSIVWVENFLQTLKKHIWSQLYRETISIIWARNRNDKLRIKLRMNS